MCVCVCVCTICPVNGMTTATEGESEIGCVKMSNVDPHIDDWIFQTCWDTYQSCVLMPTTKKERNPTASRVYSSYDIKERETEKKRQKAKRNWPETKTP